MRVLHVIEDAARGPSGLTRRGLADPVLDAVRLVAGRGDAHAACLFGGERFERDARSTGVQVLGRAGPLRAAGWLGALAVRRTAAAWRPDAVLGWSPRAMAAARRGVGARRPRYGVLLDSPGGDAQAAAREIGAATGVVCGSAAAEAWVDAGAPPHRVHAAPPPVRASRPDPATRTALRRRLGIGDDTRAVLLLGHAPHADAVRFIFLHGLLSLAGDRFIALMPSSVSQFDRGQRYFRSSSVDSDVVVTPWAWPRLLAAADVAVYDGGGSGPTAAHPPDPAAAALPIATALAAGVPVVAPRWADRDGLYPPEGRVCLAHNAVLPELARVLTPLITEPELARSLGEACRRHVAGLRPADGFVAAVESMWAGSRGAAARDRAPAGVPA